MGTDLQVGARHHSMQHKTIERCRLPGKPRSRSTVSLGRWRCRASRKLFPPGSCVLSSICGESRWREPCQPSSRRDAERRNARSTTERPARLRSTAASPMGGDLSFDTKRNSFVFAISVVCRLSGDCTRTGCDSREGDRLVRCADIRRSCVRRRRERKPVQDRHR